jgi:prevent-host-death family protein
MQHYHKKGKCAKFNVSHIDSVASCLDLYVHKDYTFKVRYWRILMGPVSLKDARVRLGGLIRAAELGESINITRHGKTVARIVPPEAVSAIKKAPNLNAFRASIKAKGKPLSQVVIDARTGSRY